MVSALLPSDTSVGIRVGGCISPHEYVENDTTDKIMRNESRQAAWLRRCASEHLPILGEHCRDVKGLCWSSL